MNDFMHFYIFNNFLIYHYFLERITGLDFFPEITRFMHPDAGLFRLVIR
jgi:hypothetical protein